MEKSDHGSQLVISLAEKVDGGEYSCQVSASTPIELTHHVTVRGEDLSDRNTLPVNGLNTRTNKPKPFLFVLARLSPENANSIF